MCWSLYLTMLTREHPSQRRQATTGWTEWLILWMLASLLPWRPQGWHGGALRRVTVMARVNVRQRLKNMGPILLKQIYLLTLWNGQPASCRDWHRALKIVPFLEETTQALDGKLISSDPFLSNSSLPGSIPIWIWVCLPWPSTFAGTIIQWVAECLIYQCGVPYNIVSNEGTHFMAKEVWKLVNDQGTHWF